MLMDALHFIGRLQVTQPVRSHIESVEMPDGPLAPLFEGIMGGGGVPMAVSGIDVKFLELLVLGQRVGERAPHFAAKKLVEFLTQLQASRALEGFKEMAWRRKLFEEGSIMLKESAPRGRIEHGSADSWLNPSMIGKFGAGISVTTLIQKPGNRFKKLVVGL